MSRATTVRYTAARRTDENTEYTRHMSTTENDEVHRLTQLAEAHMLQAEFATPDIHELLIHDAQDALVKAEMLQKGSGAWLMACIHARNANTDSALKWLQRAQNAGTLPPRETIEASPYFAGVRGEDKLNAFLDGT